MSLKTKERSPRDIRLYKLDRFHSQIDTLLALVDLN